MNDGWHVDPKAPEAFYEDVNILRHDGLAVAVALQNGNITGPEALEHARLIAAAPDLLHALQRAREWLGGWASAEQQIAIVDAAIAKATQP